MHRLTFMENRPIIQPYMSFFSPVPDQASNARSGVVHDLICIYFDVSEMLNKFGLF
jgi:hypothetical protein